MIAPFFLHSHLFTVTRNGGDERRLGGGGLGLRRRGGGEDGAEALRGASDGSKQSDKRKRRMVLDTLRTLAGSQHRNGAPQSGETPLHPLRRRFLRFQPFPHRLRTPQARHVPQFQLRRQTHFLCFPCSPSFFHFSSSFSFSLQPPQENHHFPFSFGFRLGFSLPRTLSVRVRFDSSAAAFDAIWWER